MSQRQDLPPYPRRLEAASVVMGAGAGLILWGTLGPGAEWATAVGFGLVVACIAYERRYKRPPLGTYAPRSVRRRVLALLAVLAVFAAVATPAAVLAHLVLTVG